MHQGSPLYDMQEVATEAIDAMAMKEAKPQAKKRFLKM